MAQTAAPTVASLQKITSSTLSNLILAESSSTSPTIAIIDVRDDDHVGGHIINSTHIPSQSLDHKMPELVRKLKDKDMVVFHCALSQQRGPSAAMRYLRERQRLGGFVSEAVTGGKSKEQDQEGVNKADEEKAEKKEQKVYVLERGFVGWQEQYGEDERLTDRYSKELWKDGYWM